MARLVCPACKTVHQVSVLQRSYRELPCRRCGEAIPLSQLNPPETAMRRTPSALRVPTPLASDASESSGDPDSEIYSTQSFRTPPPIAASIADAVAVADAAAGASGASAPRIPPSSECEACGALYARDLTSCPMCGFSRTRTTAEAAVRRSFPAPVPFAAGTAATSSAEDGTPGTALPDRARGAFPAPATAAAGDFLAAAGSAAAPGFASATGFASESSGFASVSDSRFGFATGTGPAPASGPGPRLETGFGSESGFTSAETLGPIASLPSTAAATIACPSCRKPIHYQALKCRHCKQFVTRPGTVTSPPAASSRAGRIAAAVGAVLVLLGLVLAVLYISADHQVGAPREPLPVGRR